MPIGSHLKGYYHEVRPTEEEKAAWKHEHPRYPYPYRVECDTCGARLWWSGLGRGSHERSARHLKAREGEGSTYAGGPRHHSPKPGEQRRRHPHSRSERLVIERELARRRAQARSQSRTVKGKFK